MYDRVAALLFEPMGQGRKLRQKIDFFYHSPEYTRFSLLEVLARTIPEFVNVGCPNIVRSTGIKYIYPITAMAPSNR